MRMRGAGITHGCRIIVHETPKTGVTSCGIRFVEHVVDRSAEAPDSRLFHLLARCMSEPFGWLIQRDPHFDVDCMACVAAEAQ